jgi:hypothetical protein
VDWEGIPVFVDLPIDLKARLYADGLWLFLGQNQVPLLTRSMATAREKYEPVGLGDTILPAVIQIVDVSRPPRRVRSPWPPKTLFELHEWLEKTEPKAVKPLGNLLQHKDNNAPMRVLVVRSPTHWYLAALNLKDVPAGALRGRGQERYRVLVRRHGKKITIQRAGVQQADTGAWVSRNLGPHSRGLMDQRVVVVGCGAIGGYIAQSLTQIGAGQGTGELCLVDDDTLQWGNLGRHYLGANSLGTNKALALAQRLRAEYPGCKISVLEEKILSSERLPRSHLLVDATGSDPLSFALSDWQRDGVADALISAWVAGTGIGAQAILQDGLNFACVGCVRAVPTGHPHSTLPNNYRAEHVTAPGCVAPHVPYGAPAAIHAAALATELATQYAQGTKGPRFRSVTIDSKVGRHVTPKSPKPRKDCPLCQG